MHSPVRMTPATSHVRPTTMTQVGTSVAPMGVGLALPERIQAANRYVSKARHAAPNQAHPTTGRALFGSTATAVFRVGVSLTSVVVMGQELLCVPKSEDRGGSELLVAALHTET